MIPRYSVIIPVYNEEAALVPCLDALTKQTTKEPFEVILVDNNCTDASMDVARSYADRLDIRIVPEKVQSRGMARKTGFAAAKGEILFSTDADTTVPPPWIKKLAQALTKEDVVAVTTFSYITDCTPAINKQFSIVQQTAARTLKLVLGHYWLGGFSFAIKKEIYEASGGFDGQIDANEDTDLSKRVQKLGKIELVRGIKVHFSGRRFKDGLIKGMYPYLKTYIDLNVRHKKKTYLSSVRD